ncbi:putative retrotransposon hot spot protein 4 (RHS4) [Trypanosoma vivax]|nr:putative retrotransposon hot spot protein 4 (RHS4) [Trypanosoma vivax]
MAERNQLAGPNDGVGATEPPLVRARLEDVPCPRCTMGSCVRTVLLDCARLTDNKMLSECLEHAGYHGPDINVDKRMDIVIQEPEQFIHDENIRRHVLSLPECQTYAAVYSVVPLLEVKGITGLRQWDDAAENTDAKRAVRGELADERLWNKIRDLMDAAFNSVKDAEARKKERKREREIEIERKRVRNTGNAAVGVILGAFESVFEATWNHVLSGQEGRPLGMRLVDGLPKTVWSDAEVNRTPLSLPTENVDDVRNDGLELLVLTSKKGWPYTKFDVPNNANLTPFLMMRTTDVVVRREVLRVWNIVRAYLDTWLLHNNGEPTLFILVCSPGIGKSFGMESYLLYELLHYAPDRLDFVASLADDRMYIFYLPIGGEAGRVERNKKDDGGDCVMELSDAPQRDICTATDEFPLSFSRSNPTKQVLAFWAVR